ncbi:MAG: Ig-like domain-containing protein [Deltaproteobacteria bacterium]|nr:Ig-like domain-containing protein [Deltaproteobacteria bacterium]
MRLSRAALTFPLLLSASLTSCLDFSPPLFSDPPLLSVPTVRATAPADSATAVVINATLTIVFSQAMDTGRVELTVTPVAALGLATWSQDDERADLAFTAQLAYATTYAVTVTGRDAAGTPLAPYTFSFTTRDAPSVAIAMPSATQSSLTTPSTPLATGTDQALVTFRCRDTNGDACMSGIAVAITSTDGADVILPASGITNSSGDFAFTITSTHPGGRTITASFAGLVVTMPLAFSVGPPAQLVFTASPMGGAATLDVLSTVTVELRDAGGNKTNVNGAAVTLGLNTPGTLGGATTQGSVNGVATFDDLTVDRAHAAHTLQAISGGTPSAVSASFDLVAWRRSTNTFRSDQGFSRIAWQPSSTTLYASSSGRVFRSDDEGVSFVSRSTGLPGGAICALAMEAGSTSIVYAGTMTAGLWKTTDGGQNWSSVGGFGTNVVCAIVSPAPNVVVVGAGAMIGGFGSGAHKSVDGGAIFTPGTGTISTRTVQDIATNDGVTYYAATLGGGIYKSTDSGGAWVTVNLGLGSLNQKRVAVHPTLADTVYCASDDGQFAKSTNGGTGWSAMTNDNMSGVSRIRTSASAVWIAGDGVARATHAVTVFSAKSTDLYDAGDMSDLAEMPGNEAKIFALTSSVLERSTNAGTTWVPIASPELDAGLLKVHAYRNGGTDMLIVHSLGNIRRSMTGFDGPWLSMNLAIPGFIYSLAGATTAPWITGPTGALKWDEAATPNKFVTATSAEPLDRITYDGMSEFVASASSTNKVAFANATGSSFTTIANNPPAADGIAARGNDYVAWSSTAIYRHLNGGASTAWTTELSGAANIKEVVFASNSVLYAAAGVSGVWVSVDTGDSWTLRANGLGGHNIAHVVANASSPSVAYAATDDSAGIYKTDDSGLNWRPINTGIGLSRISSLAIDTLSANILYAVVYTSGQVTPGLYRSRSGGE